MTIIERDRTGTPVSTELLATLGFEPYSLRFRVTPDEEMQCEWDTAGTVPDAPGLYAFALTGPDDDRPRVVYVGLTTHLWMITKGRRPDGSSTPAQRYGRHKYAGATRLRVNSNIAVARHAGWEATHWLSPRPGANAATLRRDEEDLIVGWHLRETGWNRG